MRLEIGCEEEPSLLLTSPLTRLNIRFDVHHCGILLCLCAPVERLGDIGLTCAPVGFRFGWRPSEAKCSQQIDTYHI